MQKACFFSEDIAFEICGEYGDKFMHHHQSTTPPHGHPPEFTRVGEPPFDLDFAFFSTKKAKDTTAPRPQAWLTHSRTGQCSWSLPTPTLLLAHPCPRDSS
ncbi:unnamed protein product [Ectocarpus fasciculatus]